jgi:hypothetical protein
MEPDGYLAVEFRGRVGRERYAFSDMGLRGWKIEDRCLVIPTPNGRDIIPMAIVQRISVHRNSDEYAVWHRTTLPNKKPTLWSSWKQSARAWRNK